MRRSFVLILLVSASISGFAQLSKEYFRLVREGESLYNAGDFKGSSQAYSAAFKAGNWRAQPQDRYNAACSWAMAGVADSSFYHLLRLARKSNYSNYGHITTDSDLESLHQDVRWKSLILLVQKNKEKEEANYNRPLVRQLDTIYVNDQKYRQMIEKVEKQFGRDSKEMKDLWKTISDKDSVGLIQVKKILDKYGWLGPDIVGPQGNITLFLVVQHSDQQTQEKYLPLMREAVKKGNAQPANLALLEDRVALAQGKKQIYGSQIHRDEKTGKFFVAPIEDEPNVNKRREAVGLGPLEEYVKRWNIDYKLPVK